MEVFGVVYLLINMVNGKMYVGQTTQSLKKRMKQHLGGKLCVDKAIRKHKPKNFRCEILKCCATKAELDAWERFFIAALKTKSPLGYNLTDGGEGTVGITPETRKKLSVARKGRKLPPRSPEHCANISAAKKGKKQKPRSPEHCANISAALTGKKHTAERCANISAAKKGKKQKPRSPEHCANISAVNRGKIVTAETGAKISALKRGYNPFKNLLRELDAHQLTYAKLAKLLGLARGNIARKMRCERNFTERDKVRLVEIFGKAIEYLLARDEEPIVTKTPAPQRESPYKNLLAELDARQMSYTALAKLLDLSQPSVSFKMRGERNFTERDKVKLVEIFGKAIEYLLARD